MTGRRHDAALVSRVAVPVTPCPLDALLIDGAVVTIRPVKPSDRDGLVGFYRATSAAALRLRFFVASSRFVASEVDRLTRPPDDDHVAVVAIDRGRLLGVGAWERCGADRAEFALLVRDGVHGRGVGTLLVEHLLASARDAKVAHVVASVLADNAEMLRLLHDLGTAPRAHIDHGVVEFDIPLVDTPAWQSAVAARESLAEYASLRRILCPRSIAVVGAGRRSTSLGRRILANLVDGGFDGPLYAVNANGAPVPGVPTASAVSELDRPVDVVVIAVPADAVPAVVADCGAAGVYGVVVVSDGFAESGPEGLCRQEDVQRAVRDAGMRLIGPNCLGFVTAAGARRVCATFADVRPTAGSVGLVSQSGGVALALLDYVARHRLGLSSFVSVGNKADVSGNDLLMYWQHDAATKVCALYLESFGNARKFARVARRVARHKPVVAVTAGGSVAGARATRSHTAAAATPSVAIDALFQQAGVIRAASLSELLDIVGLLDRTPLPAGRRVAVLSNSGGPAALAADACVAAGLDLPPLSAKTRTELARALRRCAATDNPVDTTAQVSPAELATSCRALVDSDDVDSVLVVHCSIDHDGADRLARALRSVFADAPRKPVLLVLLAQGEPPAALRDQTGALLVPCFPYAEQAASALSAVARYAEWLAVPDEPPVELDRVTTGAASHLVERALSAAPDGCWLDTDDALDLVAAYGIPVAEGRRVRSPREAVQVAAHIGCPVVLKTAAGEIVHRTELGGVRTGLRHAADVRQAAVELWQRFGSGVPLFVQQTAAPGVETAVGIAVDPTIGPLVMVALGGVATDLLADRVFRLVPVGRAEAAKQVRALRAAPLLFGYRGAEPCDVAALENVVLRVSRLAEDLPEIAELDLNPVIVRPEGVTVVDAKVRVAPARTPDPYLRRLSLIRREG